MATPTFSTGALPKSARPWEYTPDQLQAMVGQTTGPTTYKPDDSAYTSKSLAQLLATDNPYIQRARTKAAQYANERGLLNSSIAAGAGESAAIEAALPIAQSDANTAFTAQRDNAAAQNQFGAAANEFSRTGALSALRAGYERAAQQEQFGFQAGESAADRELRESQFGRQLGETQAERAQRESQFGRQLGETQAERAQRESQFTRDLGFRAGESAAERAARESQFARDLGFRQGESAAERAARESQFTRELGFRGQESAAERAARESQFTRDLGFRQGESAAERAAREAQFNRELGFRQESFGQELGFKQSQSAADLALRREGLNSESGQRQQQIDNERRIKEAQLRQEMQRTYMDARTQLETTQNLDREGKARAIGAMSDWFYNQAMPTVAATYSSPDAWPGAPTAAAAPWTAPPAAPAPAGDEWAGMAGELADTGLDQYMIDTYRGKGWTPQQLRAAVGR